MNRKIFISDCLLSHHTNSIAMVERGNEANISWM